MKPRLSWLVIFIVALAQLEASIAIYLRELYYPELSGLFPMRLLEPHLFAVEIGREAASLTIFVCIAGLVEKSGFTRRFALFVFLFGLWDLLYYSWLKVMIGWPTGWLEWDILFLIPWCWLGPWICPALIAGLFVVWGLRVLNADVEYAFTRRGGIGFILGAGLGLAAFLQPALAVLVSGGIEGLRGYEPGGFWWPLYLAGLALMTAGLPWKPKRPLNP